MRIYRNKAKGFTLIELVMYCSIFVVFAVYSIQMMIWIGGRLTVLNYHSEKIKDEVYRALFSSYYYRYRIDNKKIRDDFGSLISSSTFQNYNISSGDGGWNFSSYGIKINKTNGFETFNSIEN